MLFLAADGGKGSLVRLADKTTQRSYSLGQTQRYSTTFCPIEKAVVAFQSRNSAFFFSAQTQQPVQRTFTTEQVVSAGVTQCGTFLVCGSANGSVMVWNLRTGQLLRSFRAHMRSVTSVAVSPDSSLIATSSEDSVCKVWALASLVALAPSTDVTPLSSFTGHTLSVLCCAFLHHASTVVTGSIDRTCRVFEALTAEQLASFTVGDAVTALALSEDDSTLAIGTQTGFLCFYQLTKLAPSVSGREGTAGVRRRAAAVLPPSADGHDSPIVFLRFTAPPSAAVGVTMLAAGKSPSSATGTGATATAVLTASEGGAVLWYDAASCKLIGEALPRQRQRILSCVYVPESATEERRSLVPGLSKNPMDPTAKEAYAVERVAKRPRKEAVPPRRGSQHEPVCAEGPSATVEVGSEQSRGASAQQPLAGKEADGELYEVLEKNKQLESLRERMLVKVARLGS